MSSKHFEEHGIFQYNILSSSSSDYQNKVITVFMAEIYVAFFIDWTIQKQGKRIKILNVKTT